MAKAVPTENAQTFMKGATAVHAAKEKPIVYTPRMRPVGGKGKRR